MSTLNLRHGANVAGDTTLQYGDKDTDSSVSVNSPMFHVDDVLVATSHGRATLWVTGGGGMGAWTWGVILSDQDIYIEQKNDIGTPQYNVQFIPAGVPHYISYRTGGGTTQRLTGSALASGTAYGNTVQIMVQNEGATAANVSIFLFT